MNLKHVRLIAFLCIVALLAFGMIGCGPADEPAPAEEPEPTEDPAEEPAELDYPTREIEFIVPWSPGGGSDVAMRVVAEHMQKYIDQNIIIINIDGVGGTVGLEELAERPADGYTIGQVHEGLMVAHHSGITDINHDTFEPIAAMTTTNQFVAIANHLEVDTLEEFIEYAQNNTLNMGSTIQGIPRIWAETLARELDIDINLVGYEGTGERVTALAGGHVDVIVVDYASAAEHVEAGNMKFIASATRERFELEPDLETFVEHGYDVILTINRGIVAPAGTPQEIIEYLGDVFEQTANDPEYIEAIENLGIEVDFMGPAAYLEYLQGEDANISSIMDEIEM